VGEYHRPGIFTLSLDNAMLGELQLVEKKINRRNPAVPAMMKSVPA